MEDAKIINGQAAEKLKDTSNNLNSIENKQACNN